MDFEITWCENCHELQKKLELTQNEYVLNFSTLKKKIISTDMLVKKFVAKQQECEIQGIKLDQMTRLMNQLHMDIKARDTDLAKALQEVEPLKALKETLETKQHAQTNQIQVLEEKLLGAEQLQHQLQVALKQKEHTESQQATVIKQHEKEKTKMKGVEDELKKLHQEVEIVTEAKKAAETRVAASLKLAVYFGRCLEKRGIIPCKASSQVSNYLRTCKWAADETTSTGAPPLDIVETQLVKALSLFGATLEKFSNDGSGEACLDFRITENNSSGSLKTDERFAKQQFEDSRGLNRSAKYRTANSIRCRKPFKDKSNTSSKFNGDCTDKESSMEKITSSDEDVPNGAEEIKDRLLNSEKYKEPALKSLENIPIQNASGKLDLQQNKATREAFEDAAHLRLSCEEESEEYISDDDLAGRQLEQLLLKGTTKRDAPKGCTNDLPRSIKCEKQFLQETKSYKRENFPQNNSPPKHSILNSDYLSQNTYQKCKQEVIGKRFSTEEILQQPEILTPPTKNTYESPKEKEPVFQIPLPKPAPISTKASISSRKEKKHRSKRDVGFDLLETIFHETRSRNLLSPLPPSPEPFEENSDDDVETQLESSPLRGYEASDASHSLSRMNSKGFTVDDDSVASRTESVCSGEMNDSFAHNDATDLPMTHTESDIRITTNHLPEIDDRTENAETTSTEFMEYIPEKRLEVGENTNLSSETTFIADDAFVAGEVSSSIVERTSHMLHTAEYSLNPSNNTNETSSVTDGTTIDVAVSHETSNSTINLGTIMEYSSFIKKRTKHNEHSTMCVSSLAYVPVYEKDVQSAVEDLIEAVILVEDLIAGVIFTNESPKLKNSFAANAGEITSADETETASTPVRSECDEVAERLLHRPSNLMASSGLYDENIQNFMSPGSISGAMSTDTEYYESPSELTTHELPMEGSFDNRSNGYLFSPTLSMGSNSDIDDSESTPMCDDTKLHSTPMLASSLAVGVNSVEQAEESKESKEAQSEDTVDLCGSLNQQHMEADMQTKISSVSSELFPYSAETNATVRVSNYPGPQLAGTDNTKSALTKSRHRSKSNLMKKNKILVKSLTSDNNSQKRVVNNLSSKNVKRNERHGSNAAACKVKKCLTGKNKGVNPLYKSAINRSALHSKYLKMKQQYEKNFVSNGILKYSDTDPKRTKHETKLNAEVIISDKMDDQSCLKNKSRAPKHSVWKRSANARRKSVQFKSVAIIESSSSEDECNSDVNTKMHHIPEEKLSNSTKDIVWHRKGLNRNGGLCKPCDTAVEGHSLTNGVKCNTVKSSLHSRQKLQQNCRIVSKMKDFDVSQSIDTTSHDNKTNETEHAIGSDLEFQVETEVMQEQVTGAESRVNKEEFANGTELLVKNKRSFDSNATNKLFRMSNGPPQDGHYFQQRKSSTVIVKKCKTEAGAQTVQDDAPEFERMCNIDAASQADSHDEKESENTTEEINSATAEKITNFKYQVDEEVLEKACTNIDKKELDSNTENNIAKFIETNNNTVEEIEYASYSASTIACICKEGLYCEKHEFALEIDNQNFISAKTSDWELEMDSDIGSQVDAQAEFTEIEETDIDSEADNLGRLEIAESTDIDSQGDAQANSVDSPNRCGAVISIQNDLESIHFKNNISNQSFINGKEPSESVVGHKPAVENKTSKLSLKTNDIEVATNFKGNAKLSMEEENKISRTMQIQETEGQAVVESNTSEKLSLHSTVEKHCNPLPSMKTYAIPAVKHSVVSPHLCTPKHQEKNHDQAEIGVMENTSVTPEIHASNEGAVSKTKIFTPIDSPISPLGSTPEYLIPTPGCKKGTNSGGKLECRAKTNLFLESRASFSQEQRPLTWSGFSKFHVQRSTDKSKFSSDFPLKKGIKGLSKGTANKTILSKNNLSHFKISVEQGENETFSNGSGTALEANSSNVTHIQKLEKKDLPKIEADVDCYSQWPKTKVRTALKRSAANESPIPSKKLCETRSSNAVSETVMIDSHVKDKDESDFSGVKSDSEVKQKLTVVSACKRKNSQLQNGAEVLSTEKQNVIAVRSSQRIKCRKELSILPASEVVESSVVNSDHTNSENNYASKVKLITSACGEHLIAEDQRVHKIKHKKKAVCASKPDEAAEMVTTPCGSTSLCTNRHQNRVNVGLNGCRSKKQTMLADVWQPNVKTETNLHPSCLAPTRRRYSNKRHKNDLRTSFDEFDCSRPPMEAFSNHSTDVGNLFFCRRQPYCDPSIPLEYRNLVSDGVSKLCRCTTNYLCSATKCPVPGRQCCLPKFGVNFLSSLQSVTDEQMRALIISYFQQSAIFYFFHRPDVMVSGKAMLARVYTALCKSLKDVEKPRILCYDILYSCEPDSLYLIANIIDVWSTVLIYDGCSSLHEVIQFLLLNEIPNIRADDNLRSFLQSTCRMDTRYNTAKELVSALVTQLRLCQASGEELAEKTDIIQSLVLLCKIHGWEWTNDFVIVKEIWPVLQQWSSRQSKAAADAKATTKKKLNTRIIEPNDDFIMACCLKLLGYLGRFCPLEKKVGVLGIMKCMERLLSEDHCPKIGTCILEAAAEALVILKPYDPPLCEKVLSSWSAVVKNTISSNLQMLIHAAQITWT